VTTVERAAFWALVEAAGEAARWDPEGMADDLVCRLRELPLDEIVGFHAVQQDLMEEARRPDLLDTATALIGGSSEAGFERFRAWLIAQGRDVYEAALRDPGSLATHPPVRDRGLAQLDEAGSRPDLESADMLGVAERAYEHATAGTSRLADQAADQRGAAGEDARRRGWTRR
jgi:hypothetical protein